MYKSQSYGCITKCPNRNCRAVFFKDSFKGYLPKDCLSVYAVLRCPVCRDCFLRAQMINMIHDYVESLPVREIIPNRITIFTNEDQETFRQELFSDDNPLWNLYDGFIPGASTLPEDTV